MILVVPAKEVGGKSAGILNGTESLREARAILHGPELALRIGVVVGDVRAAVRFGDAQVAEQKSHGFGGHRGPAIGVDREPAMLEAAAARLEGVEGVELRLGDLESPPLSDGEVDAALLMLVLPYVEDPVAVLAAAGRAVRTRGQVVLVDMVEHDRDEYRRSMGHQHLGFSEEQLARMLGRAGLVLDRYVRLPADPSASGPGLFVAVAVRA